MRVLTTQIGLVHIWVNTPAANRKPRVALIVGVTKAFDCEKATARHFKVRKKKPFKKMKVTSANRDCRRGNAPAIAAAPM
jgi:hypothetical protein